MAAAGGIEQGRPGPAGEGSGRTAGCLWSRAHSAAASTGSASGQAKPLLPQPGLPQQGRKLPGAGCRREPFPRPRRWHVCPPESTSASRRERKQSRKHASPFRSDLDVQLPSRPAELCFLYPASVPSRAAAKPPQQFRVSSHAVLHPPLSLSSRSLYLMFPLLPGTRTQKGQILREMGPGFPGAPCGPRLELRCCGFAQGRLEFLTLPCPEFS